MKTKVTNLFAYLMVMAMLLCILPAKVEAATPKLNKQTATLYVGQTCTLKLSNNTKKVQWSSSKSSVAKVSAKGVVTAKAKGTATITAKVGTNKYTCKVTVNKPALNLSKQTIYVGQTFKLKCTPSTLNVKWASSKMTVATVTTAGKVKGVAAGTAKITATVYGKKYTCKVTVKEPQLSATTLNMYVGNTDRLICTDPDLAVTYTSSKPNVATVSSDGRIKALTTGTTTISAKIFNKKYKCKVTVTKAPLYVKYGIPSYWEEELNESLATYTENELNMSKHSASFLYFTDAHWDKNAQNSPAIINYFSSILNMNVVFGGDIIATHNTTKAEAAAQIRDFYSQFEVPVFTVIGNHDNNQMKNPDTSTILDEDDIYSLLLRQEESLANTELSIDHQYFDNPTQKIRYISFYYDAHLIISDEVYDWIDQRIKELPEDWTVVLFSHAAWAAKETGLASTMTPEGNRFINHILALEEEADATIACWMTGHTHRDYNQTFSDGKNSLLVISNNCDTYKISVKWGGLEMEKGTSTEQCIDAVQIDLDAKIIYMTRIGAGSDRIFSYE